MRYRFVLRGLIVSVFFFSQSASAIAGIADCSDMPERLHNNIVNNPYDFILSSRMTWKDDGSIDSVTILREESTCSKNICLHHFFIQNDDGNSCSWIFSNKMPAISALPSSIILGKDGMEKNQEDYQNCDLLFRGHCYKGEE